MLFPSRYNASLEPGQTLLLDENRKIWPPPPIVRVKKEAPAVNYLGGLMVLGFFVSMSMWAIRLPGNRVYNAVKPINRKFS